ncbi:hypothetical protein MNBD_PLANCTO03-1281 [hydrothermal vent metagenome]|uniref:Uncharacterized protein n=1 Tax=hydrothermal vent metagenome TaxID=652676 RepID=A0A3B1E0J4_9ZZZZ
MDQNKRRYLRAISLARGIRCFFDRTVAVEAVKRYLAKQKEHHKTMSFREELIEFLRRYQMPYDERYLD